MNKYVFTYKGSFQFFGLLWRACRRG